MYWDLSGDYNAQGIETCMMCRAAAIPPHGGNGSLYYLPYCNSQHPARLLIAVLLYFLQVRHRKYAAMVVVLSQKYSLTYGLTLTCLSYAAILCGTTIWCCTNTYGTKDAHYVTEGTQTTDLTSCLAGTMHTV